MTTPEEFLKSKHNGEIPYKYGPRECARLMKAYALHVLERVEKKAQEEAMIDIRGYSRTVVDTDDLKSIFKKIKKKLK